MITFTKILAYELRPLGKDIYEYVAGVASQQIDPPSLQKSGLVPVASVVLYSPLKRALECLSKQSGAEYISMNELAEIPFDLRKMCTEEEWNTQGSVLVRRKFKEMFVTDTLSIPRVQIFREVKAVIAQCKEYGTKDIQVVSHSFRLKIIQAFIATKGDIEKHPERIGEFIADDVKTFDFGKGFEVVSLS